jgi:replicative superfamily II helicase
VIDELQMLEDEGRGPQLELALTKLLYSEYSPQLIALSSVLGEASEPARWLGCRLLLEKSRPIELRRGIVTAGRFCYRCHNSGEIGEEDFKDGEDNNLTLFENIKEAFISNRQVLVFLKSRRETVQAAQRFVEHAELETLSECKIFFDTRLIDEEETSLLDNLRHLAACGVAFHNADLTSTQRLAIEAGYRSGMIKVIFATTTLSTGINLPAATVFIEAQKYRHQEYTRRPGLEPLPWSEYESMSGRAGRTGLMKGDNQAGRAVLFAESELEKTILWDYYIEKKPIRLQSKLSSYELTDIIVDLFGSQLARNPEEINRILGRSYHALCNKKSISVKEDIYEVLVDGGYLKCEGDLLVATPLGMAVATSGLSVAGAEYIKERLDEFHSANDNQIIFKLLHSPEGRSIYLPIDGNRHQIRLPDRFFSGSADDDPLLRDLSAEKRRLTPFTISRYKLTSLIADWIGGMSALEIENNYQLYLGMMGNLAHQVAWLLTSVASIARAFDRFSKLPLRLDQLAFSTARGIPRELRGLYGEVGGLFHRNEMIRLYRQDITGVDQLIVLDAALLRKIVSSEHRL